MANRCIKKLQFILHTLLFQVSSCCGVELCPFAAVGHVNFIYIAHQFKSLLAANVLIKRSAKIICDVVFPIGKCTGTAKAAHNRAGMAANAAFDFHTVNGAVTLF